MALPFATLVTSHISFLNNLAYFLTKNSNDADDLFQETMIKIFSNENRFESDTNFKAWARTIMRNTFINSHRGMKKATFYVDADDMQNGLYDSRLAQNEGENNIRLENLMTVVNSLEERKRTVFMTYTKGYSYEEMSEMYSINIQNLRSLVFNARQELQGKLTKMQVN
jgi:RNA polymerase sigma-70 factor, ECF subfamily